jgi:hypothetical protein
MPEHNKTFVFRHVRLRVTTALLCPENPTPPPSVVGAQAAFPPIAVASVKRALLDLFLGERMILKPTLDGNLIEALRTYPNAQQFDFFNSHSTEPSQPKQMKQLILLLLALKILCHKIIYEDADVKKKTPVLLARLNFDNEMNLCLNDDYLWALLPLR